MPIIIYRRWVRYLPLTLVAFAFLSAAFPGAALAGEPVKMHFFMTQECPHCRAEKAFLEKLKQRYPELQIIAHEVTKSEDEARFFVKMSEAYGAKVTGVPATFIGHFSPIIGFQNESTTGALIESRVKYCADSGCIDPAERVRERFPLMEPTPSEGLLLGEEQPSEEVICPDDIPCVEGKKVPSPEEAKVEPAEAKAQKPPAAEEPAPPPVNEDIINLPLIGKVEASRMALPVLTVTIAALDGFNPCAFFVLFMLLGMLVHVHSRRRMLLVGGIFVFFSGFIYFIFMAAWLNIFLLSGEIKAITVIAGLVALVIAVINIKDYFYFKRGISLSIPDSAKPRLFDRMRKLLKASSLTSIIVGTVVLAIAANAYELLCTAGFPMVFTRVLTLHELSAAAYYLYLILYNVVYVVPLATIVVLFTITLGSRKLSEHQGQVLKLVSGVMMLYLALVILFKPALLGNILVAGGLLVAALATSVLVMLASNILHRSQKI
jgi:thiol-disulfide isomerase/thioredoxin